jgi:glycosyltransferase involved in cell wall biosynthesis
MKIALINFSYNQKSGIEVLADNIIRQIEKIDSQNTYIHFVNDFAKDYYIDTPRVKKIIVKMAGKQIFKTLWLLFIYPIYSLIKGMDITIVFSGTSNFSLSPFTKNIIFIADLGEFYINEKYDWKRMIYRKYLTLPTNKMLGDLFIAISKSTQKAIAEKLKVDEQRIKLVYCGTDDRIKRFNKNDAEKKIFDKYKIRPDSKIIITIGRIDPVGKNLIRLIEAVDILRKTGVNFHLFLIGGESVFSNPYIVPSEISKRGLGEFITLTGYVDLHELNIFYNASDLLVFPSVHEGFGFPLVEAMKCELPVACCDIDVFHEVGSNAAVYFDPLDADDIADKMALVLSNASLRQKLIENGKARHLIFTWETAANELIQIIQAC